MIKLTKLAEPVVLTNNSDAWTKALLAKYANNEKPTNTEATRYRHPEIKQALIAETNGKCAYCESKVEHIHHGDVEHIYPKSLARDKTFEWKNLTLSCEICNQNKSDRDPFMENIIDPYDIDPSVHLIFIGSMVFPLGTDLGISTTVIFDLNRAALCERRKEKLEKVMSIFENVLNNNLSEPVRKAIYADLLAKESHSSSEYSAMNKSIIQNMQSKLPPQFFN